MSYEIIYDKQFIKVSENIYVPIILQGSNNCYEYSASGRERRSRSWYSQNINGKILLSLDEMLDYCNDIRESIISRNEEREKDEWYEEYQDKNFGYWCSLAINGSTRNTTFGQFKGIYITGCKKALTFEQLKEEFITVYVKNSYCSSKELEKYGIKSYNKSVSTTEELINAIDECNEILKHTNLMAQVEFGYINENTTKRLRQKYFGKQKSKEKKLIEVDKFFTITIDGNYLAKHTKRGYKYSYSPFIRIASEEEAKRKVNLFKSKRSYYEYKVEEIKEKARLYV